MHQKKRVLRILLLVLLFLFLLTPFVVATIATRDIHMPKDFGEHFLAKPVIYLYPTQQTDVSVKLTLPGGSFTCTYPDYATGWDVTAYPDGHLVNKADGREYSYLYWEGQSGAKYDLSHGSVVAGRDTAAFLQQSLSTLGLTPQEYNEFIVYWLPQMQSNPYNLITFQTDAYTNAAQLTVTPRPDSLLRVFMVYQPLTHPVNVPPQELKPTARTGFTVVEWGGTKLDR